MKNFQCAKILKQQDGSMMIVALMIMAILSIIGINAISISSTEQQITVNSQTQQSAFYDADSGVQYTLGSIENALKNPVSGVLVLPVSVGDTVPYAYGMPAGFSFGISDITMPNTASYAFTSTGHSGNAYTDAQSVINVRFTRGTTEAISFAAFGDKKMDIKNSGVTWSYDSRNPGNDFTNPGSLVSKHEADVGSNELLIAHNGSQVDGDGVIGLLDDGVTDGTVSYMGTPGPMFTGNPNAGGDRIDPDPLGIDSGGIYDPTTYSASNDNAAYGTITSRGSTTPIGTAITTKNGDTVTLEGKPGGSNFYFTDVTLKNSVSLNIDTTNGPVNIFVDGGTFDARNGSITNSGGSALDFAIYSNTESTSGSADVILHNSSEFSGVIYAPKANLEMKNSAAVHGAVFGREIVFHNSFTLFYDEALNDKYATVSDDVALISWEEE